VTVPARRPVDDALDRLERHTKWIAHRPDGEAFAADVATVREALKRQQEELAKRPTLEEAIANVNHWKDKAERLREERDAWQRHAGTSDREVADLRLALTTVMGALDLEPVVPQLLAVDGGNAVLRRIEVIVAEAERGFRERDEANERVRRLTEGLREISRIAVNGDDHAIPDPLARLDAIESVARALLSANPPQGDTAAFCEHGYTTEDSAHPSAGLERCPTCSPSDGGGA